MFNVKEEEDDGSLTKRAMHPAGMKIKDPSVPKLEIKKMDIFDKKLPTMDLKMKKGFGGMKMKGMGKGPTQKLKPEYNISGRGNGSSPMMKAGSLTGGMPKSKGMNVNQYLGSGGKPTKAFDVSSMLGGSGSSTKKTNFNPSSFLGTGNTSVQKPNFDVGSFLPTGNTSARKTNSPSNIGSMLGNGSGNGTSRFDVAKLIGSGGGALGTGNGVKGFNAGAMLGTNGSTTPKINNMNAVPQFTGTNFKKAIGMVESKTRSNSKMSPSKLSDINKKIWGDTDGDGVPNILDCQPKNPLKQGPEQEISIQNSEAIDYPDDDTGPMEVEADEEEDEVTAEEVMPEEEVVEEGVQYEEPEVVEPKMSFFQRQSAGIDAAAEKRSQKVKAKAQAREEGRTWGTRQIAGVDAAAKERSASQVELMAGEQSAQRLGQHLGASGSPIYEEQRAEYKKGLKQFEESRGIEHPVPIEQQVFQGAKTGVAAVGTGIKTGAQKVGQVFKEGITIKYESDKPARPKTESHFKKQVKARWKEALQTPQERKDAEAAMFTGGLIKDEKGKLHHQSGSAQYLSLQKAKIEAKRVVQRAKAQSEGSVARERSKSRGKEPGHLRPNAAVSALSPASGFGAAQMSSIGGSSGMGMYSMAALPGGGGLSQMSYGGMTAPSSKIAEFMGSTQPMSQSGPIQQPTPQPVVAQPTPQPVYAQPVQVAQAPAQTSTNVCQPGEVYSERSKRCVAFKRGPYRRRA